MVRVVISNTHARPRTPVGLARGLSLASSYSSATRPDWKANVPSLVLRGRASSNGITRRDGRLDGTSTTTTTTIALVRPCAS